MRAEDVKGSRPELTPGETVEFVREVALDIGRAQSNPFLDRVATWLLREHHLAIERQAQFITAGIPVETATFLACDDMGFQIACSVAAGWKGDG